MTYVNRAAKKRKSARPIMGAHFGEKATLRQFLRYLAADFTRENYVPSWPPDIFAVAASVLEKSGAYIHLVSDWPPNPQSKRNKRRVWVQGIRKIAKQWRKTAVQSRQPPRQVMIWWKHLLDHADIRLDEIHDTRTVYDALLQLCVAADEASMGAGIPNRKAKKLDPFQLAVRKHFADQTKTGSTLCKTIDRSKLCVLPKLHVPQSGMTIRSISHHLALCPTGDVDAQWIEVPVQRDEHCLNLLLIPWPEATTPKHFRMMEKTQVDMPPEFGFFVYDRPSQSPNDMCSLAMDLFSNARELVGRIDGVILPELALSTTEYSCLRDAVNREGAFLLCGIRDPGLGQEPGRNFLSVDLPIPPLAPDSYLIHYEQPKHHRWLLDKRQIVQYGLGGTLDLRKSWWEWMRLERRELKFCAMYPWLTFCALICEDLARQDPVAQIVRSVGPNLVLALLMDGPQLAERWSARYATVLADDPGSSVLTLTSIGMAQMSRPPHVRTSSRIVGLWKDAHTGDPVPIELPLGSDAVLLSLNAQYKEEWSADGRSDLCAAGVPVFGGVHPVTRTRKPSSPEDKPPISNSVQSGS
jgi:hypothetical protein